MSSIPKKRAKKAYSMPKKIPSGDVLVDSARNEWIIHKSIGMGGFGEIYVAASSLDPENQSFVIKVEPSENGPLFCEKTVYIRIGKTEDIEEYMNNRGLKSLGMPQFYGSGLHSVNNVKFRFLVMERYGRDLWNIFLEVKRIFPPPTVFKVAIQVLDVLEYIHSKGYVHLDIKGANLLLGRNEGTENQVYLVDFGLSSKFTSQFKPDPRKAHNGTVEYISRDGHHGIITRRGDIEILGYNLLQWLASTLPWENVKDVHTVLTKKNKYMKDLNSLFKACFKNKTPPKAIENYFEYLVKLEPLEEPDYELLRSYMTEGLKELGDTSSKLDFGLRKVKPDSPIKTIKPVKPGKPAKPSKPSKPNPPTKPSTPTKPSKPSSSTKPSKTTSPTTPTSLSSSPSPSKQTRRNNGVAVRRRAYTARKKVVEITPSSSEEDFIEGTPERLKKTKRSWKDCPSVVSCAALLVKDDKAKRTRRNK